MSATGSGRCRDAARAAPASAAEPVSSPVSGKAGIPIAFRWEAMCLSDDPFAGDFGDGEVALSDRMVTNRKGGTCHTCAGECEPGTRNRVLTERTSEGLETYRWCQSCCFAMAVYDRRPSIGDARHELGHQRRRLAA